MFCSKCGSKIEDNAKFCAKCGNPINGVITEDVSIRNHDIIDNSSRSMKQIAQDYKSQNQSTVLQTGGETKKSNLLMTAIIVAPLILLIFTSVIFIREYMYKTDIENGNLLLLENMVRQGFIDEKGAENTRNNLYWQVKQNMIQAVIVFVVGLVILSIPTILNVQGKKKNSKQMILTAGIIYTATVFGIPSAVLCFIAYAKMKKQV